MKLFFLIFLLGVFLCGCTSNPPRTKFSDKNMRVMLYPRGIDAGHYASIQSALVQSDVWVVLDRAQGLEAIKEEQNTIHRNETDRYEDSEKFSHWGRLYGVGAVVVAHAQCSNRAGEWKQNELRTYCTQYLNLVDANTGEVVISVDAKNDSVYGEIPDWKEIVNKLADTYPKYFTREKITERLEKYKEESKERALREKEKKHIAK